MNKKDIKSVFFDNVQSYLKSNPPQSPHDLRYIQSNIDNTHSSILSTLTSTQDILLLEYVRILFSLEYRHQYLSYNYMDFSRRIGELWQSFITIPFIYYSPNELVIPPDFNTVLQHIQSQFDSINTQPQLKPLFNTILSFLNKDSINLSLDLHYKIQNTTYNVDFKNSFNSNEKGNTQRLIQVGSIYSYLSTPTNPIKCVALVRSSANNNYLNKLSNSGYWLVYTGSQTYDFIKVHTQFDIKDFITNNIDWKQDLSKDFYNHLYNQNLLKYLDW